MAVLARPYRGAPLARVLLVVAIAGIGAWLGRDSVGAHSDGAYSHDSTTGATHTDWMATVPSSTLLSEMSIPGRVPFASPDGQ
ncbi:MAG: hypothetical protein ACKVVT_16870 [Dehalococcoidia bacterium]